MLYRRSQPGFRPPSQKSHGVTLNCVVCDAEFIVNKYRLSTAKTCSNVCRAKYLAIKFKGEGGPGWKGGVTERTKEHKHWARLILERDKCCVECGSLNKLQAHHINHFSQSIESRLDLSNGVTLCIDCHANEHPELPRTFISRNATRSIKTCPICSIEFAPKKRKQVFCGVKCRGRARKSGTTITCIICGRESYKNLHSVERGKCCSLKCAGELGRRVRYGCQEEVKC
jgi:hypothetical protein